MNERNRTLRDYCCSVCKGRLVEVWSAEAQALVVRCNKHKNYNRFIRQEDPVIARFRAMEDTGLASKEVIDQEIENYQRQEQIK